ncbi:SCO family protein [Sporosarcina sp. P20a]|uniref:SCO family protein n=1 Tax=Sporosarcina sp. P20a TaxID=2048256 RepID=UPI000C16C93F|nr:SCO family protein [Sporosarcina sp. P20a]PIC86602.1 SCO family protein [Sporosarcina sp. P20a]
MKKFIIILMLPIFFGIIYAVWSKAVELPKIGEVTEWPFTEVGGNETNFQGKPKLVTFFYTKCPDVCPTTMWDLTALQKVMEGRGISQDEYFIIAITVDPEYDTKDKIVRYKELFNIEDPNWLFFRGTEETTKEFSKYLNFYYDRNVDGFVTHSTSMYIVDDQDLVRAHHNMAIGKNNVAIEEIADHLQQLIK